MTIPTVSRTQDLGTEKGVGQGGHVQAFVDIVSLLFILPFLDNYLIFISFYYHSLCEEREPGDSTKYVTHVGS